LNGARLQTVLFVVTFAFLESDNIQMATAVESIDGYTLFCRETMIALRERESMNESDAQSITKLCWQVNMT
jgi:hypothetical protein